MEEQVKRNEATLQTRRVWQKKDFISSKDHSHPSLKTSNIPFTPNTQHQTMWHSSAKAYIAVTP